MGSQSTIDLAYIAGFLDGDGSLMLQLKARQYLPHRLMFTICFYQDSRHEKPLSWIRRKLGIGYLSRRNDGMSELRVNGYAQTKIILGELLPYIKFKLPQAKAMYRAAWLLCEKKYLRKLDPKERERLVKYMLIVQGSNYATRKKKSNSELRAILDLTP